MYGSDRNYGNRDGNRDRNFRGGSSGGERSFAPVKVGDELNVKIEAVGEKGDGIAKKDGFVLFVPNTSQGEDVKIKITKVLRKVGFAEVVGRGGAAVAGSSKKSKDDSEYEEEEDYESEETEEGSGSQDSGESEDSDDSEDSEDFGEEDEEQR